MSLLTVASRMGISDDDVGSLSPETHCHHMDNASGRLCQTRHFRETRSRKEGQSQRSAWVSSAALMNGAQTVGCFLEVAGPCVPPSKGAGWRCAAGNRTLLQTSTLPFNTDSLIKQTLEKLGSHATASRDEA
nr:hypothetical protein CFP56_21330 [Quercus suber]